ncbi:major facilitator superfamily domain-containing protein 12 [Trichonephila inaurata madagascariensis]|uniref:Major facilitator superfamily domain-containing protein 12 n=1 Tax=Trichonephila inaurata madagascariensis TaxID=2747483 RepID=A0A8X7C7X5_9ARAC|nr:major facilitator superfamily domain-containing protein 12 [Trichonephila inaurata madagascariensis]
MGKNMEQQPRLPWCQRICYSVGHSLNDLCASMWFSYLIVYLQLVLGFDSNYAGLVLLIGQVADAIATPLLGYEASNNKETGTICVVLSFPFIFSVCPGCENSSQFALTTMLIPLVIIFQIGWAAVQVSHLSLIPAITPHENERDFLNVLRYAVNIVSDIGTYVVVWCVFDLTRKPIGDHHTITGDYANKFMIITLIIVAIGTVFSFIFHMGVNEVQYTPLSTADNSIEKDSVQPASNPTFSFFPINLSWRGWLRESHFYQVILEHELSVHAPFYLQESLRANDDFIAKIPLVMNVSGFIVSCCLPKIFKVFSKKVTFLGCICWN